MTKSSTVWGNYADYSGPSHIPGSSSHIIDQRLLIIDQLVPGLFTDKNLLDVGSNAGGVSCQLAFDLQAASVTGVEIDPKLVTQANKLFALRASRVRPAIAESGRNIDYFPISAVLTHGYRIEPANQSAQALTTTATRHSPYPRVQFCSADWVATTNQDIAGPYDVILALSVIKWIHLEHLDQGLVIFFRKCSDALVPGGYFIIELQGWHSYEKAIRPNTAPHFRSNFESLKYRPETSFQGLLAEHGLERCATSDALPRRIDIYRKAG